jgi:hypothetical protein
VFITLALALVGCGGGANTSASTGTSSVSSSNPTGSRPAGNVPSSSTVVSTSAAIAQADAICTRLGAQLNAADKAVGRLDTAGLARLTAVDVVRENVALAELSKLNPIAEPPNWRQAIADRRSVVALLMRLHHYASHHDTKGLKATYITFHKVQDAMLAAAKSAGLDVCAVVG